MCTNQEINDALLRRRGYTQYEGNRDNLSALFYFFMMDASKSFFPDVEKQECAGKQKKLRNKMADGYHLFFKNFFSAFTLEQTDFLLDKVDDYEAKLAHHFRIAEIAIQECDNDMPIELQREVSRVWLCNILAADAQDFHEECWKTGRKQPLKDRYIEQVITASREYARLRFGVGPILTEKQFERVQTAVKVIAKKTVQWIVDDYYKEIGNDKRETESEG